MRAHLHLKIKRKKALEQSENFINTFLRNCMVFDIKESTTLTCTANVCSNGFSIGQGTVDVAHINYRNGREAPGCLGYLTICDIRSGMKVNVLDGFLGSL
jgi:hypothetical protein